MLATLLSSAKSSSANHEWLVRRILYIVQHQKCELLMSISAYLDDIDTIIITKEKLEVLDSRQNSILLVFMHCDLSQSIIWWPQFELCLLCRAQGPRQDHRSNLCLQQCQAFHASCGKRGGKAVALQHTSLMSHQGTSNAKTSSFTVLVTGANRCVRSVRQQCRIVADPSCTAALASQHAVD